MCFAESGWTMGTTGVLYEIFCIAFQMPESDTCQKLLIEFIFLQKDDITVKSKNKFKSENYFILTIRNGL